MREPKSEQSAKERNKPALKRSRWIFWVVLCLFGFAMASQASVQALRSEQILENAVKAHRYTSKVVDQAHRGSIFSSDGQVLAQDFEQAELSIRFDRVPKSTAFFTALSVASGIPASDFAEMARSGQTSRTWASALSPAQAAAVNRVKTEWRADGISVSKSGVRRYPLGASAGLVVGKMLDGKPTMGIELSFDKELSGQDGRTIGLLDRDGQFLPMRVKKHESVRSDGKNITLTIDAELQQEAFDAVRAGVEAHNAERGMAIILDPKTGDILSMVNYPSFDPQSSDVVAEEHSRESTFSGTTMGIYEPGSIFKVLTLCAALEAGVITSTSVTHCEGSYRFGPYKVACHDRGNVKAHGSLNTTEVIAKSCNVSCAKWAHRIGRDKFFDFIDRSGVLERPEIGLGGVQAGRLNRNDYARQLQLANLGFGQAINVTPLAFASSVAMIGNDGVRMKARLVKKVGDREIPTEQIGRVVSADTAAKALGVMEAVIESESGTGKRMRIPGYRLAGKTGTAQKLGSSKERAYVANFVGFVPAQNPRALILVMVDTPRAGQIFGGQVAGPIFTEIAKAVIRRYGILPDSSQVTAIGKNRPRASWN
jgi:cell division protein FtsI/penicillin-binding protein 2